jgi:isopenicillin N synthase-like dioxygenase
MKPFFHSFLAITTFCTLCTYGDLTLEHAQVNAFTENQNIHIPVVDMNDFYDVEKRPVFITTLREAMTTVGFFAVRNTGIASEIIQNAYNQSEEFFKQEEDFKRQSFDPEVRGQRGFVPGESAKGALRPDQKQFYHIGKEGGLVPNIWPHQTGYKSSMIQMFDELERYVSPLQQAIVEAINLNSKEKLPLDFLNEKTTNGNNLLRALYYPALSEKQIKSANEPHCWASAHTDIDLITILPYATEKGLQIEVNGLWLNVVVPPDAFIVNIGDMLENLTNGLFVSAKHRVTAQEVGKERFSMVLFIHPEDNTSLAPLPSCIDQTGGVQHYASGTRNEFLFERLLELGIAPNLLELYLSTGHIERQAQYNKVSPQVLDMLHEKNLITEEQYKEFSLKTGS